MNAGINYDITDHIISMDIPFSLFRLYDKENNEYYYRTKYIHQDYTINLCIYYNKKGIIRNKNKYVHGNHTIWLIIRKKSLLIVIDNIKELPLIAQNEVKKTNTKLIILNTTFPIS